MKLELNQKEEYKKTELGLLPNEWEVVRLGEEIEEVKEKNKINTKYPVFTVSNIYGLILSDNFFDKQVYSKKLDTYKIIHSNSFVYNPYRINVGSIGLFNGEIGLVSPAYVVFKIKNYDRLNPKFLYNLIKSPFYLSEIERISFSRGSVRRSLSFKDLSNFKIPLPPLSEQKKIASVLSTVQEAKERTEDVIKATKELKKSMMKHLFTYGPVSLEEAENIPLKETEIGPIPEGWEVVRLGDVFEFSRKPRNFSIDKNQKVPFIPMELISEDKKRVDGWQIKAFSEISSGTFILKKDLIVAKITPSFENGKQAILDNLPLEYGYATTEIWALHPMNEKAIVEHLYSYLKIPSIREDLASKMEGATGRQRLPRYVLENFKIPLPPLSEQKKIASILLAIDQKIEAEESKKKALEDLFKSLLHNLMTAKIRVNHLEKIFDE